jgi:hypothetical protein
LLKSQFGSGLNADDVIAGGEASSEASLMFRQEFVLFQ